MNERAPYASSGRGLRNRRPETAIHPRSFLRATAIAFLPLVSSAIISISNDLVAKKNRLDTGSAKPLPHTSRIVVLAASPLRERNVISQNPHFATKEVRKLL